MKTEIRVERERVERLRGRFVVIVGVVLDVIDRALKVGAR